jgi:hypothetical protein
MKKEAKLEHIVRKGKIVEVYKPKIRDWIPLYGILRVAYKSDISSEPNIVDNAKNPNTTKTWFAYQLACSIASIAGIIHYS